MEKNEAVYKSVIAICVCAGIGVTFWLFAYYGLEALEIGKDKGLETVRYEGKKDIERIKLTLQKDLETQKHQQWLYRSQALSFQWKSDSVRSGLNVEVAKYQWKSDSVRSIASEALKD